jgi:hypothetical protein
VQSISCSATFSGLLASTFQRITFKADAQGQAAAGRDPDEWGAGKTLLGKQPTQVVFRGDRCSRVYAGDRPGTLGVPDVAGGGRGFASSTVGDIAGVRHRGHCGGILCFRVLRQAEGLGTVRWRTPSSTNAVLRSCSRRRKEGEGGLDAPPRVVRSVIS